MEEKLHTFRFEFSNWIPAKRLLPDNIIELIKTRVNKCVPQDIIEAANRASSWIEVYTDEHNTNSFSVSTNDDNLRESIESHIIEEFGSLDWQYSPS